MSLVPYRKKRRTVSNQVKKVPKATKSYVDRKIKSNIDKEEDDLQLLGGTISTTSGLADITASIAVSNPTQKYNEIKNHMLRYTMRVSPANLNGTYRVILFKWKGDTQHYAPTPTDILLNADVISPYVKQDLRANFTVLLDKVFTHGGGLSTQATSDFPQRYHVFNLYKRLGNSQFNPQMTAGQGSNHIFFLLVGSNTSPSNSPSVDIHIRSVYSKV